MDVEVLASDDRVVNAKDPRHDIRPGPFVCVSVSDEESQWVPITTEHRHERTAIRSEWRSGGHPQWLRDDQYLSDGANVWRGPVEAFIAASHLELTHDATRAWVNEAGLEAIAGAIEAQRHRRDRE